MPKNNQLTSTIIDDEELIDELRRYGEKNLPTIGSSGATATTSRKKPATASAAAANLTDQNREIYLKKLNHYKAREKIETNPSKQYIKQNNFRKSLEAKRISNIYKQYDETDEIKNDDEEDDDIIEIDSKNATSEYVQVNNANTSPMSTFTYQDNDHYSPPSSSVLTSTINNLPPPYSHQQQQQTTRPNTQTQNPPGYVRLKDRIELDKTLSKYRSEINSILNNSIARNRNSESIVNKIYNNNVDVKKESRQDEILHCPRPLVSDQQANPPKPVSLFGSIKSKLFTTKPVVESTDEHNPYDMLKQIRGSHLKNYNTPLHMNNEQQQRLTTNIRKTTGNDETFFNNIGTCVSNLGLTISKLLPYLVIIIFFLIMIMYLRMKMINDTSPTSLVVQENQDSTLSTTTTTAHIHFYCADVKDTKCSGTKELLKELINYLRIKSGQIDCSYVNTGDVKETSLELIEKSVHLNQIIDHFTDEIKLIKLKEYQNDAISSMLKAVLKNPHWQIRMLNESYADVYDINEVTYLMSEVSSKSFMCRCKELAHFIWVRVVMFTSILVTLITGYFVYSKIRLINIEKDREYYDLIKQVTGMVEQHYELSLLDPSNIKPYIAISHVFHHLFDPKQRESKKKLWSKVVDFIQNQESRIHLETQYLNGEETNVWRWAVPKQGIKYANTDGIGLANSTMLPGIEMKQNNKLYPSLQSHQTVTPNFTQDNSTVTATTSPTTTIIDHQQQDQNVLINGWQGDAFNRSDKLAHSPTPCLKIRNMFDTSSIENDPLMVIRIHNDILEKCVCNKMATILHITCDKKSKEGCVYIKCNSNEAAGFVYQILNGTWYNGKLLNVKFLRSDRYIERFPDSITYTQQLRPILI